MIATGASGQYTIRQQIDSLNKRIDTAITNKLPGQSKIQPRTDGNLRKGADTIIQNLYDTVKVAYLRVSDSNKPGKSTTPRWVDSVAQSYGGGGADTISLSNRINAKVSKSNVVQNLNVPTDSTILSTAATNTEINGVYTFIGDSLRNYWDTSTLKTKYVPYTGATAAVNLGAYSLTTNKVLTDTVGAKSSLGVHVHGTGGQGIMVGAGGGGNITFDAYPTTVPGDSVLTTNSSGGLLRYDLKTKLAGYTPLSTHNSQSGTKYTLVASDLGKVVSFSNGSAITLTVPSGLGAGFYCTIQQMGAGQVTATGSGATLLNRQSHTKTKGQYAEFSIIFTPTTNTYVTQGDME